MTEKEQVKVLYKKYLTEKQRLEKMRRPEFDELDKKREKTNERALSQYQKDKERYGEEFLQRKREYCRLNYQRKKEREAELMKQADLKFGLVPVPLKAGRKPKNNISQQACVSKDVSKDVSENVFEDESEDESQEYCSTCISETEYEPSECSTCVSEPIPIVRKKKNYC